MPGGVIPAGLSSALRELSYGATEATLTERDRYDAEALGEVDQQYQLPLAGTAGPDPAWLKVTVTFDAPLLDAYDDRASGLTDPHFTYGIVQTGGAPAWVHCHVRRWITDSDGNFTGADLEIGVWRPGAERNTPYAGELHLNFQGYGPPTDDDISGEDDE